MTRKDRMYQNLARNKYYDIKVNFTVFQGFAFWAFFVMLLNFILAQIIAFPLDVLIFGGSLWFLNRKWIQLKKDGDAVQERVEEIRNTDSEEDLHSQD